MNSKRPRRPSTGASSKRPRPNPSPSPSLETRSSITNEIQSLAASNWRSESSNQSSRQPDSGLTILIYRQYISNSNATPALAALDQEEYFQRRLWPEFCSLVGEPHQKANHDWVALQPYIMSIAALLNYRQNHHPARAADWFDFFDSNTHVVAVLVEALFRLDLATFTCAERCLRITFLCHAFRALDHESMKQSLLPLLSLPVWIHLSDSSRAEQLERFPYLRKPLSKLVRRASQRSSGKQSPLPEVAIFALVIELEREIVNCAYKQSEDSIGIISELISLFSELLSQLRLRRTLLPLLSDRHSLPILQGLSLMLNDDSRLSAAAHFMDFVRILDLFAFYATFPIDPVTAVTLPRDSVRAERARRLLALQRVSHSVCVKAELASHHPLRKLPLGSHSVVGSTEILRSIFAQCKDDILNEIQTGLGLTSLSSIVARDSPEKSPTEDGEQRIQTLKINAMASYCAVQKDALEGFKAAPLMITEEDLWGPRGANESRSNAALPVLNLDFLNMNDYVLRNFALYKWESSWGIREDIEDAIARMQPSFGPRGANFSGWAKMGAPVKAIKITDMGHQKLDSPALSHVKIDVDVDLSHYSAHIRGEWTNLQQHDVVFLVKLVAPPDQGPEELHTDDLTDLFANCSVRGFVVKTSDYDSEDRHGDGKQKPRGSIHRLTGYLDSLQFHYDSRGKTSEPDEVLSGFNVVVRRRPEVNNFYPVFSSLRALVLSESPVLPQWIDDVFLGRSVLRSDQSAETDVSAEVAFIDFRDTFVSSEHLTESFPAATINFLDQSEKSSGREAERIGHKIAFRTEDNGGQVLDVKPYLIKAVPSGFSLAQEVTATSLNRTAFNVQQVAAIRSCIGSGLTLIAGPPGTGKTSCIVQAVSTLYTTLPHERILIITRTNHALNDIVERIMDHGVNPLKVLRLGQGASEVAAEEPLSKIGRTNALLERRLHLLSEVHRLAKSIGCTPGNEADWSCESADTFYRDSIERAWHLFSTPENMNKWDCFPFRKFVEESVSQADSDEFVKAQGEIGFHDPVQAYQFISNIFKELDDLRFLEVLRTNRQRGNYLVTSHASVIAMTCIHAAMQRQDLISQSFAYDTVIMEEAAECLEVEAFLSLVLQRSNRLKRVALVGDHRQLPPVVQDSALQQRSNLGQSLFARLVRSGNPLIQLDHQGRSRRSIADLFRWRYPGLKDMSFIHKESVFAEANPGFLHSAQFVDTGDLSSESQPLPHFFQNVVEAEFIAFTFLYMRMLGYPASRIAVLTTYNGQVQLLKEVIGGRSYQYGNLGNPVAISTVDKFQGRQADYVLLSLVRTKNLGHFRDVRRITVAVSRARVGLYMFGYLPLFSSCTEFNAILSQLKNGHKLALVADENFSGTKRLESDAQLHGTRIREVHSPADMASIVSHIHEMMPSLAG